MMKQWNLSCARSTPGIAIPVTYRDEWQDGFGARGWKLDAVIDDGRVIATTCFCGDRTPTCVLVHDILDHLVSGFPLSGYRNEAMATALHGLRNGIDVTSSYQWMVNEMLKAGDLHENILPFLPSHLSTLLPDQLVIGSTQIRYLLNHCSLNDLEALLLEGFYRLGAEGVPRAINEWQRQNLAFSRMRAIGMALQSLLEQGDRFVSEEAYDCIRGHFLICNDWCELCLMAKNAPNSTHTIHIQVL